MSNRDSAARTLKNYFRQATADAGRQWTSENDADIDGAVDALIAASQEGAGVLCVFCDKCWTPVEVPHAVEYRDGHLCAACASAALAAVPVSAITYLMADIAPVDEGDTRKLHESRAAVIAWLESLESEEDSASHDPMDVHESPSTTPYYHERED